MHIYFHLVFLFSITNITLKKWSSFVWRCN